MTKNIIVVLVIKLSIGNGLQISRLKTNEPQSEMIPLVCQCGHTLHVPALNAAFFEKRVHELLEIVQTKDRQIESLIKALGDGHKIEDQLPSNYVACTKISGITRKRSDSIARSLKNAKYPVIKANNKYYCDPEHAAILFPKWKKYWKTKKEE